MMNTYLNLSYCFIASALLAGSFWIRQGVKGWQFYLLTLVGFLISGVFLKLYLLAGSAIFAILVIIYKYHQQTERNRTVEVILISDRDDDFLKYFLDYYREDILKYFPHFDFRIEEEYLVALLYSKMETVGLIIAEIMNEETLRICIDYMVPKHRNSQLAKTFYQCELRCIDFLGYHYFYIEPQSKAHNNYLKRIGFKLMDGKYVCQFSKR